MTCIFTTLVLILLFSIIILFGYILVKKNCLKLIWILIATCWEMIFLLHTTSWVTQPHLFFFFFSLDFYIIPLYLCCSIIVGLIISYLKRELYLFFSSCATLLLFFIYIPFEGYNGLSQVTIRFMVVILSALSMLKIKNKKLM